MSVSDSEEAATALRMRSLRSQGIVAINQGRYPDGEALLLEALELAPNDARCHANLSVALERLGRVEESIHHAQEAVRLDPADPGAQSNLGIMLSNAGRQDEAIPYLEQAALLDPEDLLVRLTCAHYHAQAERWPQALDCYAEAYHLDPTLDDTISGYASALSQCGRDSKALLVLRKALRLDPSRALTWNNAACVLRRLGRNWEAVEYFDRALELDPEMLAARWGRSLSLLALGHLRRGWDDYECGMRTVDRQPRREFAQPRWDGSDLNGKTLLVWMEQGLGDHLVWASMFPDLIRYHGARLLVECEVRLVSLLQRSFPSAEVFSQTEPPNPRTQSPDIDYQIPGGSLPRYLRPTVASFPPAGPYLVPDPVRVAAWRERLALLGPGPKVGISWRSLKTRGSRALDCMSLGQWQPILSLPGIHWVNLQPGWDEEELLELDGCDVKMHLWQGLDLKDDQDEMAALISSLSLVVSAFTVTAQMAGGLDVPTWVLAHRGNQSWFNLGTDYCPWHPSIRFFWCKALESWEFPIRELAGELRRWAEV